MNLNINRLFKLGIRSKLTIAFLALSAVPLLLTGVYAIRVHTDAMEKGELSHLEHDVLTIRERTSTFLEGVESDVRFLGNSVVFRRFLDHPGDRRASDAFVQQVLGFTRSKRIYYQIQYLDTEGRDGIRVRLESGRYVALPDGETEGRAYYANMVAGLGGGEMAFSPVELTDGRGGLVAAISYAMPVFGAKTRPTGILVADVFVKDLFRIIEETHANTGGRVALADPEGHYVYDSARRRNWGQFLATQEEHNVYRDYPADVARRVMSGRPGMMISNGEVVAYSPLLQLPRKKNGTYVALMSVPRGLVLASTIQFERVFYWFLALFVCLSVGLAYLAAAQFTRPINALQAEAEIVAGGEFGRRLSVETYDEIHRLAETFNGMAEAIQERERQIRQHGEELEGIVADRTRELAEEKEKLQAILDSVPNAFVVLDRRLHILSASRAFEKISGLPPAAVIGQPLGRFLPDCSMEGGCPAAVALRERRIVGETQPFSLPGEDRPGYIERIAIPVAKDGTVERVIEVLTDVTARKEMESRVIHSEKLATTGEMAAVIAHEMRNSLTSVKMILQLELEREDKSESDQEALGVASDSVRRMETVVTQLLKFARPSPLQFQPQSINAILRDAVSLIQHQTRRKAIALEELYARDLPPVRVDSDQLKEVFVNLLLNAAQASPDSGWISVGTRYDQPSAGVEVCVEDAGPGLAAGQLERIFDPFYTTKPDGTGLGLSMARRTIEAHGGSIRAVNLAGAGARFVVALPSSPGHDTERPTDG